MVRAEDLGDHSQEQQNLRPGENQVVNQKDLENLSSTTQQNELGSQLGENMISSHMSGNDSSVKNNIRSVIEKHLTGDATTVYNQLKSGPQATPMGISDSDGPTATSMENIPSHPQPHHQQPHHQQIHHEQGHAAAKTKDITHHKSTHQETGPTATPEEDGPTATAQ